MDINMPSVFKSPSAKKVMKKGCVLMLLVVVVSSCNFVKEKTGTSSNNNPDFNVDGKQKSLYQDLQGNPVLLSDYKGKKVLLNFWATWCQPCTEEMPALARTKDILEKENYVILLASDEKAHKIKDYEDRKKFNFKYIRLTRDPAFLGIYALPTTFIYNESGKKVDEISGVVLWDSEKMIEKLKNIK